MLAQIALSTGGWRSGEVCRFALSTRGALRWGLPVCSRHGERHGLFLSGCFKYGRRGPGYFARLLCVRGRAEAFFPRPSQAQGAAMALAQFASCSGGRARQDSFPESALG